MSLTSFSQGGVTAFGPSSAFLNLPFTNFQDAETWVEEWIDAMGIMLDIIYQRFISPAAKANLINPGCYTPQVQASTYLATTTQAPTGAVVTDTMLDLLCYVCGFPTPVNSKLTIDQKQALASLTQDILKRKGTRHRLLKVVASVVGNCYGWTVPPFNFSIFINDGQPSPGYGEWISTGSNLSDQRPWILSALRALLSNIVPAWASLGIGFTKFRAGYSAAGEIVTSGDVTLNILPDEHFTAWTGSPTHPTGWTLVNSSVRTVLNKITSDGYLNPEFYDLSANQPSVAQFDLTGANNGDNMSLSVTASAVNNQLLHRFEIDYQYTNTQQTNTLVLTIQDTTNSQYYNPTNSTWQTASYLIVLPWSATRTRYECDVLLQSASATAATRGTETLLVTVSASCDGTANTKIKYNLYRIGLFEDFNVAKEEAVGSERTLWLPLTDAPGWSLASRTSGGVVLEPANAQRTAYKLVGATGVSFPYHPAITARGFASHGNWTNLLPDTAALTTDWFLINCTAAANATVSPIVGEVSPTATVFTSNTNGALVERTFASSASGKTYVGGVWVKKLSADSNFTDVSVTVAATSTITQSFTVLQSDGWKFLPCRFVMSASEAGLPVFYVKWGAASTNGQLAVIDPYLYDVTGKADVLYPPVVRGVPGAFGTTSANSTTCKAITSSQGVNVLQPLLKRSLVSVVRGSLDLTVVPTFGAANQPDGYIFSAGQSTTANNVSVRISSHSIVATQSDGSSIRTVSVGLTTKSDPTATQVTWVRDRAILVRTVWDTNALYLSVGTANGSDSTVLAMSDASVANCYVGSAVDGSLSFDGIITGVEVLQLGAPIN